MALSAPSLPDSLEAAVLDVTVREPSPRQAGPSCPSAWCHPGRHHICDATCVKTPERWLEWGLGWCASGLMGTRAIGNGRGAPTKVEGNTVDVADAVYLVGHAAVATGHRSRRRSSPREARLGRRRAKGLPRSAQASGARRKGHRSAPRGRDPGSGPAPVDTRPGRSHYRGVPGRLVKR